jgi:hypothetical protein
MDDNLNRPISRREQLGKAVKRHQSRYSCSLCDDFDPTTKRNNVEQHIWAHHSNKHGRSDSQSLIYRAKEHKEVVAPYVVLHSPQLDGGAWPVIASPTLLSNSSCTSNNSGKYSPTARVASVCQKTYSETSTACSSFSNGSSNGGDSITYEFETTAPSLSCTATSSILHHHPYARDAGKPCRTSGVSSRRSSIDSELELHFSHSLAKHRQQPQPIMNVTYHFQQDPRLNEKLENFNANTMKHVHPTSAERLWRPYML